jgi:ribonuclease HI
MTPSKSKTVSTSEVQLFADGACSGNPGPGGWAFILKHPGSGKELEKSGGQRETTNNRMELTAVIRGLETLKRPASVELVTDSMYVGKGLSEWLPKWKANGWRRREGKSLKEIKNEDLWRQLDELIARHKIHFTHVRGHAGHEENERCDALAVAAYQKYLLSPR